MRNTSLLLIGLCSFFLMGCGSADVYFSPEAERLASNHRNIAIAPPSVSIEAKKNIEAEAMKEQQKTESRNFQREMHAWMLKRKSQGKIRVEIQDVETTNAKLKKAGYFDDKAMTPKEISEVLGVDGVITSNYDLSQPMSEAGAIATGVLLGVWGSTNETTVNLEIHDRRGEKLIWSYNDTLSGSVGSSPGELVDHLMRKASKKMPYTN